MATVKQRGKSWQLRWSEAGQERRRSLGQITKPQALTVLRAKQLELSPVTEFFAQGRSASPTVLEWAEDYVAWHELEYPDSHYRVRQILEQHLVPEFGTEFLDRITPEQVERYKVRRRREGMRSQTVTKELRTLKALINRAQTLNIIQLNPIRSVSGPRNTDSKPHRYFSPTELSLLYAACAAPEHAAWWRLYVNTGMRRMEGLHLRWCDVGHDGLRIVSTEAARTKSGKWRDIPKSVGAARALEELKNDENYVLPRMHAGSISRAAAKDVHRAGLSGSLHTFRHTFISQLVLAGTPLRTVQLYAGHSSIVVTEQYAYLIPDRAAKAIVELNL